MKDNSIKFILLILFFVSLSFAVGFLSGSFLSYKNCIIKYVDRATLPSEIQPTPAYIVDSLKHVFEYPVVGTGYYTKNYPLMIVYHEFLDDRFCMYLYNKEKRIKILSDSINFQMFFFLGGSDIKCENGPLKDVGLGPEEAAFICMRCNSTYKFKPAEYIAFLNTTFMDLSSGEKIYGNVTIYGAIPTYEAIEGVIES